MLSYCNCCNKLTALPPLGRLGLRLGDLVRIVNWPPSGLLSTHPAIIASSCTRKENDATFHEVCWHHLFSPHLTSPHLTSPHLTSPHLTSLDPPSEWPVKPRKAQQQSCHSKAAALLTAPRLSVLQSRELLLNLLQLDPSNTRALGILGSLEWKAGRRALARKYLTAGIEADPKHVSNLHSLARLELEEGNLQGARELFAQGQQLEPHNAYILQVAIYLLLPWTLACGSWLSRLSVILDWPLSPLRLV